MWDSDNVEWYTRSENRLFGNWAEGLKTHLKSLSRHRLCFADVMNFAGFLVLSCVLGQGQASVQLTESLHLSDELEVSVSLHGEQVVRAGDPLPLVVTVNKAPNFEGSNIQVRITGPDNFALQYGVALKPGVTVYEVPFQVPAAAAGGVWTVSNVTFNSGGDSKQKELPFQKYTFRVIPNEGLEFPTSADIGVNPSQVQLLRTEAIHLQERIREIKSVRASMNSP